MQDKPTTVAVHFLSLYMAYLEWTLGTETFFLDIAPQILEPQMAWTRCMYQYRLVKWLYWCSQKVSICSDMIRFDVFSFSCVLWSPFRTHQSGIYQMSHVENVFLVALASGCYSTEIHFFLGVPVLTEWYWFFWLESAPHPDSHLHPSHSLTGGMRRTI